MSSETDTNVSKILNLHLRGRIHHEKCFVGIFPQNDQHQCSITILIFCFF